MARAIRIHRFGGPEVLEFEDVEVGKPAEGEVLLQQRAVGLNYIDVYQRSGTYPNSLPLVLGNEASGEVMEVGPGVEEFRPGDRVAYGTALGAYAEQRIVAAKHLVKLPDAIDYDTAAVMMLKGMTAQYLLRRTHHVGPQDVVLVQAAAGGVGLILCQWAKSLGATVIGTAGSEAKAELARRHGADHVILYRTEDVAARVKEITGGEKCTVVYDSVGQATFEGSLDSLRPLGLLASFGAASGQIPAFSVQTLAQKGSLFLTRPTLFTYAAKRQDLLAMAQDVAEAITSGTIKIDVHSRVPLCDTADAHRALEGRDTVGATVLIPDVSGLVVVLSQAPPSSDPPLIEVRGLVKQFGPVVANGGIDFDVRSGESHALLGENGAGKSTLVKILYGLLEPTDGTILWKGRPVRLASPEAARALGIGMVFQHFSLFENLTVAENIGLVLPPQTPQSLEQRIVGLAAQYGLKLEPARLVWTLSAGERQRIEIARCLLQDPRLIILDEPTSVLTPQEAETLFETLDRLKAEGRALLYISHRLEEVKRLCDRATILRGGKVVATCNPRQESARSIAAMMVGTQIADVKPVGHEAGAVRFAASGLSVPAADLHGTSLRRISFAVRAGEILGVAGVAGNGQDEFFAALSGETPAEEAGQIAIDGQPVGQLGITARRLRNAAFVPEERNGHAAVPNLPLSDNTLLSRHATGGLDKGGFVLISAAKALAQTIVKAFDVRVGGPDPAARTLSGGNLQKFLVGREILREPAVLVINQPTWGVDAAAAAAIHQAILDLAGRGGAVLVISQDLDELFAISDRLAVIHGGELSAAVPVGATNRGEIGLLMTGSGPAAGGAHAH